MKRVLGFALTLVGGFVLGWMTFGAGVRHTYNYDEDDYCELVKDLIKDFQKRSGLVIFKILNEEDET